MVDLGSQFYGEANTEVNYFAGEPIIPILELLTPEYGDTVVDFANKLEPSNVVDPMQVGMGSTNEGGTEISINILSARRGTNIGGDVTVKILVFYRIKSNKRFNYNFNQTEMWGGQRPFVNITNMFIEGPPSSPTNIVPSELFVEYEFTIVQD